MPKVSKIVEEKKTEYSLAAGLRGGQFDRTRNFGAKSADFVKR